MAFYIDKNGVTQQIAADQFGAEMYREAQDKGITVAQVLNRRYADADLSIGTACAQICASEGLVKYGKDIFGLRAPSAADVLNGTSGFNAANVKDVSSTYGGSASRSLFPVAILDLIEDKVSKDYMTDSEMYSRMVAQELSVSGEIFERPVISYGTANGPEQAKAQRIAQFTEAPLIAKYGTADRVYKLPTYGIQLEFSQQALKASTLDMLGLTLGRFLQVEKDARIYNYLSALFAGDNDLNTGAVSAVTTTSFDSAATGGVVTHKAWVKWLASARKTRRITHVVADIDTYLKVEGRTGRPGSNNYDPTLARIDPQARVMNGFGNDVEWFIVDSAANGGPVPANTIWALDAKSAIMRVSNTSANYQAAESFVLRRSESMVIHWSEECFRLYGNTDLTPFTVLTIA
jgi:hypothetical protein